MAPKVDINQLNPDARFHVLGHDAVYVTFQTLDTAVHHPSTIHEVVLDLFESARQSIEALHHPGCPVQDVELFERSPYAQYLLAIERSLRYAYIDGEWVELDLKVGSTEGKVTRTIKKSGVVAEFEGKYWGIEYADGQVTCYNFVPIEDARMGNAQFTKKPTDMINANSPDVEKLRRARLVPVTITTTYEIG